VSIRILSALITVFYFAAARAVEMPVSFDDRLTIELVAQEPDIVTPTGVAVDSSGSIWVIENNTHFTPKNYKGAPSDRIKILDDFGPDGRARKVTVWAEGFRNSMNLVFTKDGGIVFATRSEITLFPSKLAPENRVTLIKLETKGNYPHNGLAGLAIGPDGKLYFGLGENLGEPYKLIGADGTTLTGGGEGGNIYRCDLDGSKVERIATGFWNPWGLGFDAFGRLFAVDNDPDSRPPCRLLHIVTNGDYGYKFRYGRKGIHPFVAWNGEIPGTLPMVAGTGEAPCAVYACESPALPKEWLGDLLVTCWGDHVIQRFHLEPMGASFHAMPEVIVKGSANFRPVGMVQAADGSLVVTDWVSESYPVHGKGRVWRIKMKDAAPVPSVETMNGEQLRPLLSIPTIGVRAAELLSRGGINTLLQVLKNDPNIRARNAAFLAGMKKREEWPLAVDAALNDKAIELRLQATRALADNGGYQLTLREYATKDPQAEVRSIALSALNQKSFAQSVVPKLSDVDPFSFSAAIVTMARFGNMSLLLDHAQDSNARMRLGVLLALRKSGDASVKTTLPKFLADPDAAVRRAAMQWVGEERLTEFAAQLDDVAKLPMTRDLFEAYLAAKSLLSGDKPDKGEYIESQMAQIFPSDKNPLRLRVLALKNLRVDHPGMTVEKLKPLLANPDPYMRAEVIRALSLHHHPDAQAELRKLDPQSSHWIDAGPPDETPGIHELDLRADVVAGLARSAATSVETREYLLPLLDPKLPFELQREALRSLRPAAGQEKERNAVLTFAENLPAIDAGVRKEMAEQILFTLKAGGKVAQEIEQKLSALVGPRPATEAEWKAFIAQPNPADSPAAGARIFYHERGPRCFQCHRINGRGGNIGPDLSTIGKTVVRDKMLESILDPAREVAPQFVPWTFVLTDGRRLTGTIVEENDGVVQIGDSNGAITKVKETSVDRRAAQKGSVMPDKLVDLMTMQELRDLLSFLQQCTGETK